MQDHIKQKLWMVVVMLMCFAFAKAQLSFCSGTTGTSIFEEDFGTGLTNGPPLPAGVTTYQFVNSGPQDGQYTISNNAQELGSWFNTPDHTGNTNGKMLIVNASFTADQFYRRSISGLCENTPYEFSAWIMNVLNGNNNPCGPANIPIQVQFEIWDSTDTTILASGTMAPRQAETQASWIQYGLTFTTSAGQNSVILKMINVGNGGCGNDLAIDDIAFKACGDETTVIDNVNNSTLFTKCIDDPDVSLTLTASATSNVFMTPEYQWQSSADGTIYTDIPGATTNSFITPLLTDTTFYRAKVAEDAVNLNNAQCFNFSEIFEFREIEVPLAVPREDPFIACDGDLVDMVVDIASGTEAFWYDAPTGGNLVNNNSIDYTTNVAGFYYVETVDILSGCVSTSRVPVELRLRQSSTVNSEDFILCEGEDAILDPQFTGGFYQWSSGASTQSIVVNNAGTYTCIVTNLDGCDSLAIFNVAVVETAVISELQVVGDELTVILANTSGNYRYSIDGFNYQSSPVFDISGLLQVDVRVRDERDCDIVFGQYNRIIIPQFFTPNNDGFNDTFKIPNIEAFPSARIEIFDRYGKLLKQINTMVVGWDGLYQNQPMPSDDYWYKLHYNDQVITGHFSLKR